MQDNDNKQAVSIPCLLFDPDYYDKLAAIQDKAVRMHEVARSLVANGMAVLPCLPYDPEVYADKSRKIADRKKASGKAPAKRQPYSNLAMTLEQVDEWWDPKKGKHRGQNVGLATGEVSDLLLVDIDADPEDPSCNGWPWVNEQLAKNGHVNTIKVRSGGKSVNGQHWYFKHREGFANSVSMVPGVDIRTNKGHVMAPLCECQSTYHCVDFQSEVPPMPEWLFEALTEGKSKNVHALPGSDKDIEKQDRPEVHPILIRDALSHLPIEYFDGGGIWMKIAMAIHSEHPDETGWEILDDWSSGRLTGSESDSYDEKGNRLRWDSFKDAPNNLTMGTLFFAATTGELDGFFVGGGWEDPRQTCERVSQQRAITMMNKSFAIVDPSRWWRKMKNYPDKERFGPDPISRVPTGTVFATGFDLYKDNYKDLKPTHQPEEVSKEVVYDKAAEFAIEVTDTKGNIKLKPAYDAWRKSPAKRVVRGVGYYVNEKRLPKGVLNLFTGWGVEPKKGVPQRFLDHVLNIICCGDEEKASWIINRLAYTIQFGEKNLPSALVINGAEGLGKNIFWEYIEKMAGVANCHYTADPETFTTRFSEELVGKFFVNSDEALFSGDLKADGKTKGLIGNGRMRDEGKGKAAKQSQNVSFFIFFSNHDDPVMITRGNRRFCVMTGNDKYSEQKKQADPAVAKEAVSYFKALAAEKDGDGPAHLLHMLMNYEVNVDFARTALTTVEKSEMAQRQDVKRESIVEWILYLLESEPRTLQDNHSNDPAGRWGSRTPAGKLYDEYNAWVKDNKHNHASRGWVALNVADFKKALTGHDDSDHDFLFESKRGAQGNTYEWPDFIALNNAMHEKYPHIVERIIDLTKETEF